MFTLKSCTTGCSHWKTHPCLVDFATNLEDCGIVLLLFKQKAALFNNEYVYTQGNLKESAKILGQLYKHMMHTTRNVLGCSRLQRRLFRGEKLLQNSFRKSPLEKESFCLFFVFHHRTKQSAIVGGRETIFLCKPVFVWVTRNSRNIQSGYHLAETKGKENVSIYCKGWPTKYLKGK